jgi:hypothetical protein
MGLRRVPQVELEAFARAEYRKKYAAVPRPKLVNLDALVEFLSPQVIAWAGVSYRAPPVAFALGVKLMVAGHAMQDLRVAGAAPPVRLAAARVALSCLRSQLKGPWYRRHFRSTDPDEIEAMTWRVLYVPDQGVVAPDEGPVTIDYMDITAHFARELPAWCGPDGLPLSWKHYQYGLRHLRRASARETIRQATAVRAAGADAKDYRDFESAVRADAGWH